MVFIGCAGGFGVHMNGVLELEQTEANVYQLEIKGLRGGHSGIDIHLQQGNAIILLGTFITENNLRVCSFDGGKAHNIIPRDARAIVSTSLNKQELQLRLNEYIELLRPTLHEEDKIEALLTDSSAKKQLNHKSNTKLLALIHTLPHGPHKFERESKEILVSQSSNLAEVKTDGDKLSVLSSVRFFDPIDTKKIKATYQNIATLNELSLDITGGYPSWKPVYHGDLLELVKEKYKDLFGIEPAITAIHAGLECGIVKDKLPELDIISIGPTIRSAHTPRERIEIPTVESFWKLLTEIVKTL
jgi:dipeptidase D